MYPPPPRSLDEVESHDRTLGREDGGCHRWRGGESFGLKITSIRSVIVHAEMRNWIFVRVETDQDGLFGWGEATLEWKTRSVAAAIEDLAPLVIGRDPRDIEKLVRIMKKHSFWRLGVIGMSAVSGIEIALWDILGKSLSVPVWMLLGGRVRDRVQVYTHLGLGDMRAVYETESAKQLVERENRRHGRSRGHRRRPAQSDRPDCRGRRAALRRIDLKPRDPGGNGRGRSLVF